MAELRFIGGVGPEAKRRIDAIEDDFKDADKVIRPDGQGCGVLTKEIGTSGFKPIEQDDSNAPEWWADKTHVLDERSDFAFTAWSCCGNAKFQVVRYEDGSFGAWGETK